MVTSADPAELASQYAVDGYTYLPGGLTGGETSDLVTQMEELAESRVAPDESLDVRSGVLFQVYDVLRRPDPLGSLARRPLLINAASTVLKETAQPAWGLVLNKVNDNDSNWRIPWHQDTSVYCSTPARNASVERRGGFLTFRPSDDSMGRLVVARIAIDGDNPTSGCLHVVPGSHHLGNKWPGGGSQFAAEHGTPLELNAGGVLLFNPLLFHRAELNRSTAQRRIIHIYYRPQAMKLAEGATWIDW